MVPFLARLALIGAAGRVIGKAVEHPRLAPIARSRKGRLALLALGFGLRRHPRTRLAGHVVRRAIKRV